MKNIAVAICKKNIIIVHVTVDSIRIFIIIFFFSDLLYIII